MILKIIKHLKRAYIPTVAVLLFAIVLSVIICALCASNEAEMRHYEETWKTVPISVTVTELSRTNTVDYPLQNWVYDVFVEEDPVKFHGLSGAETPIELSLTEYVKDVQVSMSHPILTINGTSYINASGNSFLIGITSISCDKRLLPEYGCEITWYEGYDESVFDGKESVCLIPADMSKPRYYDNGKGEAELYFFIKVMTSTNGGPVVEKERYEYRCTLKIVGTYTAGDEKSIYCPLPIVERVYNELEQEPRILSLSATLADNSHLEEFREKMSLCFIEPSPYAEKVPWGYSANGWYNEFYPYALDINDDNLFDLAAILEESIKFNRTVTVFVVVLSAVSGFLVGFLMIRRRKQDIILMRTVGESNTRVYCGFVLEQMICILLGIAIGGAYFIWKPIDNLLLFALVYFLALSLALVIFLRQNLLTTIKEDE